MNGLRNLITEARALVAELGLLRSTLQRERDGYLDWSGLARHTGTAVPTLRRVLPEHLKFRITNRKVLFRISEVDDFLEQYREPPERSLQEIAHGAVRSVFEK